VSAECLCGLSKESVQHFSFLVVVCTKKENLLEVVDDTEEATTMTFFGNNTILKNDGVVSVVIVKYMHCD